MASTIINSILPLTILTYNCTGFSEATVSYLEKVNTDIEYDIIFLQETWLYKFEHDKLFSVEGFLYHAVSGMEDAILRCGRKKGGCSILYKKSLADRVKHVMYKNDRVCAIKIRIRDKLLLLVNAYLPCDTWSHNNISDDFIDTLNAIAVVIEKNTDCDMVLLGGDFNTDLKRDTAHARWLNIFLSRYNLKDINANKTVNIAYTYESYDGSKRSRIDTFFVDEFLYKNMQLCKTVDNGLNVSNHISVVLRFKINMESTAGLKSKESVKPKPIWRKIDKNQICKYQSCMDDMLYNFNNNKENMLKCRNIRCINDDHQNQIDILCRELTDICLFCSKEYFMYTNSYSKKRNVPFWNDIIKPLRDTSLFWHWLWSECGRPRVSAVANTMRRCRAKYHYALRKIKRHESELRMSKMAVAIANNNSRSLWDEVKKCTKKRKQCAPNIDGISDSKGIAKLFAEKYRKLYNSAPFTEEQYNELKTMLDDKLDVNDARITLNDVQLAIKRLKIEKSDANHELFSDHLIYSTDTFKTCLAQMYTSMLIHGHIPEPLTEATVTSIPKDTNASLCNADNYRGISLLSSICKVFDIILLDKYSVNFKSCDLQFGFKKQHSTVMAVSVVKEVVSHYLLRNSDVYMCLLDASKAFDKVHFRKLFEIMMERNIPSLVIRVILDSYVRQKLCTEWEDSKSDPFIPQNGVRQGGILSPFLFCIYLDKLIGRLKDQNIGCHVGNNFIGCVAYADDMCLLSPTVRGLETMLKTCEEFSVEYSLTFNPKKTKCMLFSKTNKHNPDITFCKERLTWKNDVLFLGCIIDNKLSDRHDVLLKCSSLYSSFNRLCANFSMSKTTVMANLFQKYCSSFYGSQSWKLTEIMPICIAWNKCVRRLWKLPNTAHRRLLPLLMSNRLTTYNGIECRFLKFYLNWIKVDNDVVKFLGFLATHRCNTPIGQNRRNLICKYDLNANLKDGKRCILNAFTQQVTSDDIVNVQAIKQLTDCMEGSCNIENFVYKDYLIFIQYLATH